MKTFMIALNKNPATKSAWLFAVGMFCTAAFTIFGRLDLEVKGTVVETRPGSGFRRSTWYTMKAPDGSFQTFIAGATDASLPRDLGLGTLVEKRRWQIGYALDHQYRLGFPVYFYSGLLVSSLVLFFIGLRFLLA